LAEPLLEVRNLTRMFYGVHALEGVHLSVPRHRITGLIGPNGAGKSTLFNCVSGVVAPNVGTVHFAGRDITGWRPDRIASAGLVRTFQIACGFPRLTVYENLMLYGRRQPGERVSHSLVRSSASIERERALMQSAHEVAQRLNLVRLLNVPASALSGGQKKLLEIGRVLMSDPQLILLDEPVAGVNPALIDELKAELLRIPGRGITLFIVEHNLKLVFDICDWIFVLDRGRVLTAGTPEEVSKDERVIEAYLGRG